jgi:hypothetical protein
MVLTVLIVFGSLRRTRSVSVENASDVVDAIKIGKLQVRDGSTD